MTEAAIVAIIVAIFGFAGTLAGSFLAHRKTTALVVYRLEQLEKKVEEHNSFDARVKDLETCAKVSEEKHKVASHRIDDLEKGA